MAARCALGCAALSFAPAARGRPADGVAIATGEALEVRLDDSTLSISARAAGELQDFEAAAAGGLWEGGSYKVGTIAVKPGQGGVPSAPAPAPDVIRFKLVSYPEGQSLLAVENGYDRALVYRARLVRGGRLSPTTVCLVQPGRRTLEHWPYRVDGLQLDRLRLVPWRQGDEIPCK
jgi:hypothetical protein